MERGSQLKSLNDRNNVMVIAKYNAAVELEHLKRTDEARGLYERQSPRLSR